MELGTIWVKIANNQKLTSQELDFLRNMGRETQIRNSFVTGAINGQSNVNVNNVFAEFGNFSVVPINSGWLGWSTLAGVSFPQDLTSSNTLQVVSTGFTDTYMTPQSIIQWYDKSTGKIQLSYDFVATSPRLFSFFGNALFQSPSTNGELVFSMKRKSDNSEISYGVLLRDTASADIGGKGIAFSATINLFRLGVPPSSVYFEFMAKCTFGIPTCGVAVDAMFFRPI